MLSAAELRGTQRRRRSPYSDKQHYQEYVMQKIEGYKNSIPRGDLLRIGDEAASELRTTSEGQFVLTEVLMLDTVDRLIMKRLAIRPYRRWRQQFIKLRAAQRTPTHWGLDPNCALARILPRLEAQDVVLVIGTGAEATAYLLAAHDASVTFIAGDLGCVERVESRIASESLGSMFDGFVHQLGPTLPDYLGLDAVDLLVLDPGALLDLSVSCRGELIRDLQRRTPAGGVHVILPTSRALAPAALLAGYDGWTVEENAKRRRRATDARRAEGLVLCNGPCPGDTRSDPGDASV